MINVTKTYLPPKSEYEQYLKQIWSSNWVTNNGPMVKELEEKLKNYFKVKHLFFTSNGTIVLQMAIKALELKGEIITTPFSYVATTTALLWENCVPVFADIDPENLNLDPSKIEALITPNTTGILATHVYGIPCNIEKIKSIADKYKLKIIYDAAHTFGTKLNGKHLLSFGDISTISFHATKLFHTIEGGAIVTNNDDLAAKIRLFRSFGHINDDYYSMGINAKNSEFHAAMGLCLFHKIEQFIEKRKELTALYNHFLEKTSLKRPLLPEGTEYNSSYYPVIFPSEELLLVTKKFLEENGINTRRYFYPSLNKLPYIQANSAPVSERIAKCVLCLPLYFELSNDEVELICNHIIKSLY